MLWKKSENLKVNIAPATAKLIFVDKDLTLPEAAYFGVDEGKSTRFEFGASVGRYYKFDLIEKHFDGKYFEFIFKLSGRSSKHRS